jgi:hypothetical protein
MISLLWLQESITRSHMREGVGVCHRHTPYYSGRDGRFNMETWWVESA